MVDCDEPSFAIRGTWNTPNDRGKEAFGLWVGVGYNTGDLCNSYYHYMDKRGRELNIALELCLLLSLLNIIKFLLQRQCYGIFVSLLFQDGERSVQNRLYFVINYYCSCSSRDG